VVVAETCTVAKTKFAFTLYALFAYPKYIDQNEDAKIMVEF